MGRLKIYDPSLPAEDIRKARERNFAALSAAEKFNALLRLISVSVKMNGGQPLKLPQGKGLIIRKSNRIKDLLDVAALKSLHDNTE